MFRDGFGRNVLDSILDTTFQSFMRPGADIAITGPAELPRFRGSAIPHCPIQVAIDLTRPERRIEHRDFRLDWAAEHGRTAHAVLQRWLGVAGVMFGRWRCSRCGIVLPEAGSGKVGLLGPVRHCDTACEYDEYEIDMPQIGYSGHCDGLLVLQGKLLPIEMKVRNSATIVRVRTSGPYSIDNLTQATSYRRCLPLQLRIPEAQFHNRVGLLYFDRADIRKRAVVTCPYQPGLFDAEIAAQRSTQGIIERRAFNELCGFCATADDRPFCPYHNVCFSSGSARALEQLLPGFHIDRKVPACRPSPN